VSLRKGIEKTSLEGLGFCSYGFRLSREVERERERGVEDEDVVTGNNFCNRK
jgi:hypothetical protein